MTGAMVPEYPYPQLRLSVLAATPLRAPQCEYSRVLHQDRAHAEYAASVLCADQHEYTAEENAAIA
jgi:hypothetical protein